MWNKLTFYSFSFFQDTFTYIFLNFQTKQEFSRFFFKEKLTEFLIQLMSFFFFFFPGEHSLLYETEGKHFLEIFLFSFFCHVWKKIQKIVIKFIFCRRFCLYFHEEILYFQHLINVSLIYIFFSKDNLILFRKKRKRLFYSCVMFCSFFQDAFFNFNVWNEAVG